MHTCRNSGKWLPAIEAVQLCGGICQIHIAGGRVAVHENRNGTLISHDLGGRRECHRRHEDRVTGFQSCSFDGQMQRGRARVDGYGVAGPYSRGELLFEAANSWARRQPARVPTRDGLVDLALADRRSKARNPDADRERGFSHGVCSAVLQICAETATGLRAGPRPFESSISIGTATLASGTTSFRIRLTSASTSPLLRETAISSRLRARVTTCGANSEIRPMKILG